MLNCSDNDIEKLLGFGFIEESENTVYYISHWEQHTKNTDIRKRRLDYSYRKWREKILSRDNYKCCLCGEKTNLHVHHEIPISERPELTLYDNNGITLCSKCHIEIHKKQRGKNG
jgi:5-methylcytosine-specific restriction endonuclease McrA